MERAPGWQFWIDTGGTFTDCLACTPAGEERRIKVLSTGAVRARVLAATSDGRVRLDGLPAMPDGYFAGFDVRNHGGASIGRLRDWRARDGAAVFSESRTSVALPPGEIVDLTAGEEAPVLAMRLLTGTRVGEPLPPAALRLATTRGTNALLEGKGARVAFFVTAGFGDLLRIRDQRRPDLFALRVEKPAPLHGPVVEVRERLAADGTVVAALDESALRAEATVVLQEGIDVAAVALLHSHRNPAPEHAVAAVLRELGFAHVSVSSELAPFIKILPRAETAVVDAVLAPVMERYLSGVARAVDASRFFVMTSAGGLVRRSAYCPKDSLLSGPAGGVAGAAAVARRAGFERVLTFDMGGTSTDVARWEGDFDYRFQHTVGPARVFAPALRVETVAAGGGSICRFDGAALVVGPESAGAAPGPACYGGGGPLTLTDVNLLLGRIDPARFGVPVFVEAAEARLAEVVRQAESATGARSSRSGILQGFLDVADERMAEAIRRISVREGYDPAGYALVAFGGAGGLHACAVAERIGVRTVLFPADSGLLSASGLHEAVAERFAEKQVLRPLTEVAADLSAMLAELEAQARRHLAEDGVSAERMTLRRSELELRFAGQEAGLTIAAIPLEDVAARFAEAYGARFGYAPHDRALELVTVRVAVSAEPISRESERFAPTLNTVSPTATMARDQFRPGDTIVGPGLVQDSFSTLYVAAGWRACVGSAGSFCLERTSSAVGAGGSGRADVVELELFTCRFLALVDEMGVLLQRCALSVNVKERMDFSCALLDAEGELVANAPHIPVHLGALGLCVRTLRECIELAPGDVVVTNHPGFGGSHLPDITLVAPVHAESGELLGFVANRAHHAEIGGVRPGSLSPAARNLAEEGVVLAPFHLVRSGKADWDGARRRLVRAPFPSRAVEENIADLHAQLAAIRRGSAALCALADREGAARVRRFMDMLKARAADVLAGALARRPEVRTIARDALDDGTLIVAECAIVGGRLRIDFTGSGGVHAGNLNATPGIVRSAVIYVLRVLAGCDLPLNEGFMRDVTLVVPRGVLSPDFPSNPAACPAVAGGNVETSQRVVDVLFSALGLGAASQGTMNNLVFGTTAGSYYETVCGGTGAGPGFAGCDAVHSHMTNTAITDPEILETRHPVRLEAFAIRSNSGGDGRYRGGNGVERRLRFLAPAEISLVTQRRQAGPPGGEGGGAGATGCQWVERTSGEREDLPAIVQIEAMPGDLLVLRTPGGGGFGRVRGVDG